MTAPHGALMNQVYRHQRHFYDATRKYYLLGRDRLIRDLAPPSGGTVLEIGCGTGRNLIAIQRRYPEARCFGLDISEAMLETARNSAARHGLDLMLAQGDATDFSAERLFGVPHFDRVVMSYTLSMIPDWRAALGQGLSAVAPGGWLAIVDFGTGAGFLDWWLGKFHVRRRADLADELARQAEHHQAALNFRELYRGYSAYASLSPS